MYLFDDALKTRGIKYSNVETWFLLAPPPNQNLWLRPWASINYRGARVVTRSTTWKVWSKNLPISTFSFTTCLMSGGLEKKTITWGRRDRAMFKNHCSKPSESKWIFGWQCRLLHCSLRVAFCNIYLWCSQWWFFSLCGVTSLQLGACRGWGQTDRQPRASKAGWHPKSETTKMKTL